MQQPEAVDRRGPGLGEPTDDVTGAAQQRVRQCQAHSAALWTQPVRQDVQGGLA